MLSYFPELREDELLYGALARYRRHMGSGPAAATMVELFGRRTAVAAFDLPGHLRALADRLPAGSATSFERLVSHHTLLPYYAAFTEEAARLDAVRRMADDPVGVHQRLGVAASTIRRPEALRFCPACRREMVARFGEAHWLRAHQLPGSLVCPVHLEPLLESRVSLVRTGRHELLAPDEDACPASARPLVVGASDAAMERLVELAQASGALLAQPLRPDLDDERYLRRLARAGLMRSSLKVDQVRLREAVADHWGDALPLVGVGVRGSGFGWLEDLTRSRRKAVHPLHHLLIGLALGASPVVDDPVGWGPWACRNPLADHRGELVVARSRRYRNRDAEVCIFECGCGHSYTRSLNDGELGPPRLRSPGPLLEPALRQLVRPGASLRAVAREVGLDPKSVVREAMSLGIPVPWDCAPSGRPRRPVATVAADAGPRPRRGGARGPRCDWGAVDREMTVRMRHAVSLVLRERPPVRVTVAELERRMGRRGWLGKRRDRLPMTSALARNLRESTPEFQLRRVVTALDDLSEAGAVPPAWRIMRAAGLSGAHLGMIEDVVARRAAPGPDAISA